MTGSVVIPNWNGRELLPLCLDSLPPTLPDGWEVIVVDDGSTDGSGELLRRRYPAVRLVELGENRGFAAAANAGIRAASASYVALLNNDVEVTTGWLPTLVAALDTCPEAGFAASKLLNDRERDRIDGAGDGFTWEGNAYRIGHGEVDRGQYDRPEWVFGACAAAALYRRSMLDTIGLFDERFVAYYEDADLSFRAQLAGNRCRYVPEAVVYHVGSATSRRIPDRALYLQTRNRLRLVLKNYPVPLLAAFWPFVVRFQLRRLRAARRDDTLPIVKRALFDAVAGARGDLAARRNVQRLRRVSCRALVAVGDLPRLAIH